MVCGVSEGIRTLDLQGHNLAPYRLATPTISTQKFYHRPSNTVNAPVGVARTGDQKPAELCDL